MCLSSVLLSLTLSAIFKIGASSRVTLLDVGGVCEGIKSGEQGAVRGSGELRFPLVCFDRKKLLFEGFYNTVDFQKAHGARDRGPQKAPTWLSHTHRVWLERSLRRYGGLCEYRLINAHLMPRSRHLPNLELCESLL